MEMEIQWENPKHFLLDRKRNAKAISIELFSVPSDKNTEWFVAANQTPVPIQASRTTPAGFEILTIETMPEIVYLRFTVRYEDAQFNEVLLVVHQLLWFNGTRPVGSQWDLAQWMPVLSQPGEQEELALKYPLDFSVARSDGNPLVGKPIEAKEKVTIKIDTSFLDITNLWWKAIEKNAPNVPVLHKAFFVPSDLFARWYEPHIRETGSRIVVVASTNPKPPLIWFVIVPEAMVINTDSKRIFSQVYYRPNGWRPESRWVNGPADIVGPNRVENVFSTLLWCVMSPVKVLEQSVAQTLDVSPSTSIGRLPDDSGGSVRVGLERKQEYAAPDILPYITDRYKLIFNKSSQLFLDQSGIWSPQRMAASVSEAKKPQIVFMPVRQEPAHGAKDQSASHTVAIAVEENLDRRLRVAASMLWTMNRLSISTPTFPYEDDFVISGYSSGGALMWLAAEKNLAKMKALIAFEPGGRGVETAFERMKKVVDGLVRRKKKVFFVGQYKTSSDFRTFWEKTRSTTTAGITYMPPADGGYDAFFANKPATTTNLWLRYVFTGLIKRDNERSNTNAANPEPHPEPDISMEERKAINKLGIKNDAGFGAYFDGRAWFGIPVLHLFAMCGGQIFTPPKTNKNGIVTVDAVYKTFYQEAMEQL
jgi:hypothetical protein